MDVRKKLVELFHQHNAKYSTFCDNCFEDDADELNDKMFHLSDHLIAHGVTVQECGHWEDDHGDYVCSCCHTVFTDDLVWLVRGESNEPNYCPNCGAKMMPQPPKGE